MQVTVSPILTEAYPFISFASHSVPCLVSPTHALPLPRLLSLPLSSLPTALPAQLPALSSRVTFAMSWSGLHTGMHYSACPSPYTIHHLPPHGPCLSFPGSLATPTFYPRESQFRGPGYNIPNIPVFPFPYSLLAPSLPFPHHPWSSYLGLVLSGLTPALSGPASPPFSRIRHSHSLSSRLPSRSSPALLP